MNTKNIFKALALAMLMPAMVLTTACSSEDDNLINNNSNNLKGFELPVTVNVTRQGDEGSTRATYNESTKKLSFSTGDKLFVRGSHATAGQFAGTLDYDAVSGKFSGTIYTKNPYEDTADALFTAASTDPTFSATLLPNGFGSTGFLYVATNGTAEKYDDQAAYNYNNAFALTKAAGVEQLSYEVDGSYSSGFSLRPCNPILNFTITGLSANTEVAVAFSYYAFNVNKNVTTNSSGTATFAIGVAGSELNDCSLTVGGNVITLGSHVLTAGYIYNITRSAAPAPAATDLSTINANYTASDGEILTGTLASNVKISIADGATVTLDNVTINGTNDIDYKWAGITCLGDATIILSGTNTVKGFDEDYPGIQAAAGKTLIINGTGSLTASSYGWGAGIGGGSGVACGDIEIQDGTITATGGGNSAGIGGGYNASWGNITISGGTVTATGGQYGAGIGGGKRFTANVSCGNILISGGTVNATGGADAAGIGGGRGNNSGYLSSCGTITITTGVSEVTATKGSDAPNSIGAGNLGTCGTVTIGGNVGAITTSPYTYQP